MGEPLTINELISRLIDEDDPIEFETTLHHFTETNDLEDLEKYE